MDLTFLNSTTLAPGPWVGVHNNNGDRCGGHPLQSLCSYVESLEIALRNLPLKERRELDEAREMVPQLVQHESKFIHFLERENFDVHKAATRLALFWKLRKDLFGERWLLPMTQTGDGALNMTDIEFLRTGFILLLRRFDRPPLVIQHSGLLHRPLEMLSELRLSYYYACSLMTDEDTLWRTEGATVVHIVTSSPRRPQFLLDPQLCQEYIPKALPYRLKESIVVQAFEQDKHILLETLATQQAAVTKYRLGIDTGANTAPDPFSFRMLKGNSVAETVQLLALEGVPRQYVPTYMGGDFDHHGCLTSWIRSRISVESILSSVPVKTNAILSNFHPNSARAGPNMMTTLSAPPPPPPPQVSSHQQQSWPWAQVDNPVTTPSAASSTAFTTTIIGSTSGTMDQPFQPKRSKRVTSFQKHCQLRDEVEQLRHKNVTLRESNRRLEHWLAQARWIAANHESNPVDVILPPGTPVPTAAAAVELDACGPNTTEEASVVEMALW